jgi:DNA-directed RNA polymerase specialized sigma24 family protein
MDDREILAGLGTRPGRAGGRVRQVRRPPVRILPLDAARSRAAKVLRETFTVAAKDGAPKHPGELRAWLYNITRDQAYRRMRTAEPGFDEIPARPAGTAPTATPTT